MPDALATFQDLEPLAKAGAIAAGILVWLAGLWLLSRIYRPFR